MNEHRPRPRSRRARFMAGLVLGFAPIVGSPAAPEARGATAQTLVAVAANFLPAMARLEPAFESTREHRITVVSGSSGKLATQIRQGAPFAAFLSADRARPARLEAQQHAVAGSRFTYALGRLVLWSRDDPAVTAGEAYLSGAGSRALALANPELAPYGAAARQVLKAWGLWASVAPHAARAENVGQAYAMAASGAADAAFVSLSTVLAGDRPGYYYPIPADLHDPIEQQATLTARGREDAAARAFLQFLRSGAARALIAELGYALP